MLLINVQKRESMGHYECSECGSYVGFGHETYCSHHKNIFDREIQELNQVKRREVEKILWSLREEVERKWLAENPEFSEKLEELKEKSKQMRQQHEN